MTGSKNLILVTVLVAAFAMEQRVTGKSIYWQDSGSQTINVANLDGTNVQTIVTPVFGTGIVIDDINRKIYWTATDVGEVRRANLDGTGVELLVEGLSTPRGLALDMENGRVFWAEIGQAKISSANLDGTGVDVLVDDTVSSTRDPHDVQIDLDENKMYWTDSFTNIIYRSNIDGSNIEEIVNTFVRPAFPSPRGLALDIVNDFIYWSSLGDGIIYRAGLDGSMVEPVVQMPNWMGPHGITLDVSARKVYWTSVDAPPKIQRANLDGTDIEDVVTEGLITPVGIAIGPTFPIPAFSVVVDIKPGSDPNSVQLKSKGVLPVAIISTDEFDALEVDPASLLFGDPVLIDDGKSPVGPLRFSEEDITRDGVMDLVFKFSIEEMISSGVLGAATQEGLLTGSTFGGVEFVGSDAIRILSNIKTVPEPSSLALLAIALWTIARPRYRQSVPSPIRSATACRQREIPAC